MYSYLYTQTFTDSVAAFAQNPRVNVALVETLGRLAADPFDDPVLRTHRVERAMGKTFSSRVGGGGRRLIWRQVQRSIVLLLFGEHDPVYLRAENLRLDVDTETDRIQILDIDPTTRQPTPYRERRASEGRLFMAWTDEDLAGHGLTPPEIAVLRRLDNEQQLADLEEHMSGGSFELAFNLVAYGNPGGQPEELLVAAEGPGTYELTDGSTEPADERDLEARLHSDAARAEFVPVEPDALAAVLARPIEDWMVFLHPDQVRLAQRPFSGPARIRGGAGTGKTVVALHRAQHLAARHEGRILFTTYVRNLPPVFEELFRRLSPSTRDRVEFINIHKWAFRYLSRQGNRPQLDPGKIDAAHTAAWAAVTSPGSYLEQRGYPRVYYREEIDWVIKGRGLESLDTYLGLERTGRGSPLNATHRRAVWELYETYQRELTRRGLTDFNGVLIAALAKLREDGPGTEYRCVIVDEAQDLTEVGVRVLHALVGDRPDGLLLVGDAGQSVYPGGYNLRALGIDVVGRAGTLRVNYRNTQAIIDAAERLRTGATEDSRPTTDTAPIALRAGRPVVVTSFSTEDDHDESLALAISAAVEAPGVDLGDLAVLVPTNRLVQLYERRIADLGLRTLELQRYDGSPTSAVKVGTYQRAKGLEFKQVFLPRLDAEALGEQQRHNEEDETFRERLDLLRRQLFVALTRARDDAWLGAVGAPARLTTPLASRQPGDAPTTITLSRTTE